MSTLRHRSPCFYQAGPPTAPATRIARTAHGLLAAALRARRDDAPAFPVTFADFDPDLLPLHDMGLASAAVRNGRPHPAVFAALNFTAGH